jgi:sterol desaturase/sphingolipid hydroxylase (fatty acid hydroxylase superfamily)
MQTPLAALQIPALIVLMSVVEVVIPLHRQARVAGGRLLSNLVLTAAALILGILLNGLLLGGAAYMDQRGYGALAALGLRSIPSIIVSIFVLDFATYAAHVFLHKSAWAWRIHLVHHVDRSVDATTTLRHHPMEHAVRFVFLAGAAWALGAPPAALALYRLLSVTNGVFEHANVRVPKWLDRALVWFWVTPDMHKLHHSRIQSETDSNYSNLFSFFDRLFGTFTPSGRAAAVNYGIEGYDSREHQSLGGLLRMPFRTNAAPVPAPTLVSSRTESN